MEWPPKKRDYPRQVVVGDSIYDVKFVRKIDADNTLGLCCSGSKTIWIRQKQTRQDTFLTFIHELLHAIEFEYELNIEHKLIHDLEKPIADLLFDNFL